VKCPLSSTQKQPVAPATVITAVLQDLSQRSGGPLSNCKITRTKPQNWPDGCLGLGEAGVLCTQAIVPGWRVTVVSGQDRWVYRTNRSGSVVKWDKVASAVRQKSEGRRENNFEVHKNAPT
jgi:hypothetical protein